MIVVDSSVLIDTLRSRHSPSLQRLRELDDTAVVGIGDIVLLEVLRGARDDAHAARLDLELHQFLIVEMMSEPLARRAAANHRRLRSLGITVHSIVDSIVGTFCIDGGHELLHADRDFRPMVEHFGLREYRPNA